MKNIVNMLEHELKEVNGIFVRTGYIVGHKKPKVM